MIKTAYKPVVSPGCAAAASTARRGERGAVLIIAISLLAIMAILGAVLLSVSTSELQLSGNYRNQQDSFFAAERAVEYAVNTVAIGGGTVNLNTDVDSSVSPSVAHSARVNIGRSGLLSSAANTVAFVGEGALPPGSGSDDNYFKARNYVIDVTAASPNDVANPARTRVRAQIAKLVAK